MSQPKPRNRAKMGKGTVQHASAPQLGAFNPATVVSVMFISSPAPLGSTAASSQSQPTSSTADNPLPMSEAAPSSNVVVDLVAGAEECKVDPSAAVESHFLQPDARDASTASSSLQKSFAICLAKHPTKIPE